MNGMIDVLRETLGEVDFDPAELKTKYLFERDKRLRDDANDQYRARCDRDHCSLQKLGKSYPRVIECSLDDSAYEAGEPPEGDYE